MANFNEKFNEFSHIVNLQNCTKNQAYVKKIKEIYKYEGLKKLLGHVLKKILSLIFTSNSAIWFEKNLNEDIVDFQKKIPLEINYSSTYQTIEWLINQNQDWLVHPKEIFTALKYNHYWPSVSKNEKIIGCIKIGFENVFIVDYNRIIKFPEKMAFIYDTYVLQKYRGKGVAKYLITQAILFLKSQGYTKVRCHIPDWNIASINAYEKIGFKKISHIICYRILGISIRKINPISKNYKFKAEPNIAGGK
jgi:ribosomal protein S18 acetylase RimI-like enzyme